MTTTKPRNPSISREPLSKRTRWLSPWLRPKTRSARSPPTRWTQSSDADGKTYLLRPAQEHLLQNERRLDAVLESVADVITVVDRQGAILSQTGP